MQLGVSGKRVIVTGATAGLGKAVCKAFAREGAHVVMNHISAMRDQTEEAARELQVQYPDVTIITLEADITDEARVEAMFLDAEAQLGGTVDILVNNAGICPVTMITDTSYELWKQVIDVNLNGVFLTCREMARRCIAAGVGGKIVNVVSPAAFKGSKRGKTHYSASKGAVVSFTVSFAQEVAKHGIYVNAIAPGMMLTEMTKQTLDESGELEKYNQSITIGRLGDPDEVADGVVFLASEAASYSTGSVLDVSGGMIGR